MKLAKYFLTLLTIATPLAMSYDVHAASASRLLSSRLVEPVKSFVSLHPRLTKAAGVGAVVGAGCLLYTWWKNRGFLPIKSGIAFLVPLPNGNLVVGEWEGSYLSVWDTTKRSLINRVHIGDMTCGTHLQIVVLSEDTIVLRSTYEHAPDVTLVCLNPSKGQTAYQKLDEPVNMVSKKHEKILWIAKRQTRQLVCKTEQDHYYQLENDQKNGGYTWKKLADSEGEKVSMPFDALGGDPRLEVRLLNRKTARVVSGNWFWNGVEIVGKAS